MELYPLPVGEQILAAHILIKTRDVEGKVGWYSRVSPEFNHVEFLGALIAYTDHLRQQEASSWADDDEAPQGPERVDPSK